jgi:hypothetical protein
MFTIIGFVGLCFMAFGLIGGGLCLLSGLIYRAGKNKNY